MRFVFLFVCLFWGGVAFSDPATPPLFSLEWSNDYVAPGGKDRWLSNEFIFSYREWSLGQEMYTPTNKRSFEIPEGDRNWDGYTYLEYYDYLLLGVSLTSRIGVVGDASGAPELQQWVHDDLGFGSHPSWATTNPSEPTVDFIFSKRDTGIRTAAGVPLYFENEFGIRAGTVKDLFFIDQQVNKEFGAWQVFLGLRGEIVLYNTFLDGRLFQDNVYTVDKNWFLASGRAGVEYSFTDWFVRYTYKYLTEEFKGQIGRHLYGSLEVGFEF